MFGGTLPPCLVVYMWKEQCPTYMCSLAMPQNLLQAWKRKISSLTFSTGSLGGAEECFVMLEDFNACVGSRASGDDRGVVV